MPTRPKVGQYVHVTTERPTPLAAAGSTAWRLLGIGALVVATWLVARYLMPVLVPVVIALLLATLLHPIAQRLEQRGLRPSAAAFVAMLLLLAVVVLIGVLIVPPFASRIGLLGNNVEEGLRQIAYSIGHDIANISRERTDRAVDDLLNQIEQHRGDVVDDVLAGATALAQALGASVLILFLCFFIVRDADRLGRWFVELAPRERRPVVERGGVAVWTALGIYIRGVIFVATVDATLIGLTLVAVGVPLALPLIVVTWLAAFFPFIGAIVAGSLAVLVALVGNGTGAAIIVAVAIIAVQQIEGNLLYPIVVGPRLKLHPIAVLLAVLIGATVGGVAGAFLAVPIATAGAVLLDLRKQLRNDAPQVTVPEHWPEPMRQ